MNYEWKVVNAELFTQAQDALNQLDQQKYEIVSTHTASHNNQVYLSIVARKVKPTADIRY